MLEWSLLENKTGDGSATTGDTVDDHNTLPLQVATTLQSTDSGRRRYFELCDRQLHLKELVIHFDRRNMINSNTEMSLGKVRETGVSEEAQTPSDLSQRPHSQ